MPLLSRMPGLFTDPEYSVRRRSYPVSPKANQIYIREVSFLASGVMAAMAIMAAIAIQCPNFDSEYLLNQGEFRHGVETHTLRSSLGCRFGVVRRHGTPQHCHDLRLLKLIHYHRLPRKAAAFGQGLRVVGDVSSPPLDYQDVAPGKAAFLVT